MCPSVFVFRCGFNTMVLHTLQSWSSWIALLKLSSKLDWSLTWSSNFLANTLTWLQSSQLCLCLGVRRPMSMPVQSILERNCGVELKNLQVNADLSVLEHGGYFGNHLWESKNKEGSEKSSVFFYIHKPLNLGCMQVVSMEIEIRIPVNFLRKTLVLLIHVKLFSRCNVQKPSCKMWKIITKHSVFDTQWCV
jgi:hypothetical protein